MVSTVLDKDSRIWRIVLKPNQSWSWRANLYILYTLLAVSTVIGLTFTAVGAWPVLPWSVLEMIVLALCIYCCVLKCHRQEVITISEHTVLIERGTRGPVESFSYHRLWSKFLVQEPDHPWDPAIISIRSHGKEQEIGAFLNRQDKSALIHHLKDIVRASQQ